MSIKTIEERAKECTRRRADVLVGTTLASIFEKGYIAGATDQKIIDEGIKIKKCDSMTRAEADRETAFLKWWYDNDGGTIAPTDAIEWARKEAIEEAKVWFGDYLTELRDSVNWFYGSSKMKSGQDRFMEAMKK